MADEMKNIKADMAELKGNVLDTGSFKFEHEGRLNDTDLEERVTVLEFQMNNVNEKIVTINDDVSALDVTITDLDKDVEEQITIIQADQVVEDERLLNVEYEVEEMEASVLVIEEDVTGIEESTLMLNASVTELEMKITQT